MTSCIIEGCDQPKYRKRNYCNSHYMRLYRYGDPNWKATPRREDVVGQTFGTLTVVEYLGDNYWLCQCECGETRKTRLWNLKTGGEFQACGKRNKHFYSIPTYANMHVRVARLRGPAKNQTCTCGKPATQWSYDHLDPNEHLIFGYSANPIPYSEDVNHYVAMCTPCHKLFDLAYLTSQS